MVNVNVFTFFIIGTLGFGWLALRFIPGKAFAFRMFGIGLSLLALAFAVWSAIIVTQPADLSPLTTVGVIPFAAANLFFVAAGTSDFSPKVRRTLLLVAAAVLAVLLVLRTVVFPSVPSFSENGLFYFNAHPIAILLYVIVFAGGLMPAVHVVTSHISNHTTAMFTRLFFNVVTLSGVVLLVSTSDELQYWNGYILLAGLIGLTVIHARRTPEFITR